MNPDGRLRTLDGLRGLAAVLVMLFHARDLAPVIVPRGYMAVDLFFVLSGFVIARAYDARLRSGLSLPAFAVQRLVRIYPMYAAGTLIGLLLVGGSPRALFLLPDMSGGDALYPVNVAMWSLVFELGVNLAYAAGAARIGWRGLAAIVVASGAVVARGGWNDGNLDAGAFWSDGALGMARTVFGFALGALLFRLRLTLGLGSRRTPLAWLLFPALIVLLTVTPQQTGAWDVACALVLLPMIVWLGSLWDMPHSRLLAGLGDLSYPLYCIHMPVLFIAGMVAPALVAPLCMVLPLAALLLDRTVDRPVRAWLTAITRRRPAQTAAT